MGLLYYENQFSKLRVNRRDGQASPHKVAMLLAVIDLFDKGRVTHNRITFDQELKLSFTHQFEKLAGPGDRDNPYLPYFHLRSSGFWHHYIRPGKQQSYDQLTTASGTGVIDEHIQYVFLDDELYELLGNEVVRKVLHDALYRSLEDQDRFSLLDVGNGWNWLECECVVDLYFRMLEMQVSNQSFVKTKLYAELVPKLNNRNIKSIEAKCQNVSAIMVQYGYPYVLGLKPRLNYQKQLEKVVLSQLVGQSIKLEDVIKQTLIVPERELESIEWGNVFDAEVPDRIPDIKIPKPQYLGKKINYSQRESNNRQLGASGEKFVMEYERYRLAQAGRADLVDDVKWASEDDGDGLGYDIRSFDPVKDEERFIEVKTTNSGKYFPFFISANEVNYSRDFADNYSLYRVYQFKAQPRLFMLDGEIDKHVHLHAKTYMARFS